MFMHVVCVTCAETCGAVSGIEMDRFSYISIEKIFLQIDFSICKGIHMNMDNSIHNAIHSYVYTYTMTGTYTHIQIHLQRKIHLHLNLHVHAQRHIHKHTH